MQYPNKAIIERLKEKYPIGCRVELVHMIDPYSHLPEGEQGIVKAIDDMGTIHVAWDCGSSLGIVYGEDECRRIRVCPKCGCTYTEPPAMSRVDNKTEICPDCGMREAIEDYGKARETMYGKH